VSKKSAWNEWGKPKNLGPVINTPYDEDAPFIHPDGKTLYFSSKGHPSLGGFDVFTTMYNSENDSVTKPVNVGYPINTADDEIFFIWSADGARGYFSSVREDTYGRSDIYMVTRPDAKVNLILLSGIVKTSDNKIEHAVITIRNNETNKILSVYDSTKFKRNYAISLEPGKNYGISFEAKGYLTYSENINIPVQGFHNIKKDVTLIPIDKGGLIVLNNVFFEPGKSDLKKESSHELDRYLALIKENPSMMVEIAGHAFDFEDHKSNLTLSEERAQAVVNYLIQKGAKPENLRGIGYGDRFKVTDATQEDERINTRTEFIIKQALQQTEKQEKNLGYYYGNESKAMAQSKLSVNNSINTQLKEQPGYLIKKDEDVYLGINTAKSSKELKTYDEIKAKVKAGDLKSVVLKGVIKDIASGEKIQSEIIITDDQGKKISDTETSEDGQYEVELFNDKERKYTVTALSPKYNYKSKNVVVPANGSAKKELVNDFMLTALEVGKFFLVRNIYFDNNAASLKEESYKELKKVVKLLKSNNDIKIMISAHTDAVGGHDFNMKLSQRRAEAVVRYLLSKGIKADRLVAKGFGETQPLASNDDEAEGRELNRRIEFEVLEK
jgi:outer membrane protein OmpA-like peptidoglycan-associated protein